MGLAEGQLETRIGLRLEGDHTYEAGAVLLSVLAWPEMIGDDRAMGQRHAALCQMYLAARSDADPGWANRPQLIKPLYFTQPERRVRRFDRELHGRLDDRMVAARVAIPFLRVAAGQEANLPGHVKRLSLEQVTELVLPDRLTRERDPKNFQTRVWRPSRPVIHIASAIAVILNEAERQAVQVTVGDFLLRSDLIADVVGLSERYAVLIPDVPGLDMQPEKLIRLGLV